MLRNVAGTHHVPRARGPAEWRVLWSDCLVMVATARALRLAVRVCGDVVGLTVFFDLCEHAKASLRRDEARHNLLSDVLGGGPEQILQLNRAKLLDDGALFADALVETFLKFIQFTLFLIKVLDESPSSLLHFVESTLKTLYDACHWSLDFPLVLRVPDIMSNELLDGLLPLVLEKLLVAHDLEHFHQSVDILDEDIVASDQYFFLLLLGARCLLIRDLGLTLTIAVDRSLLEFVRSSIG